MAYFVVNASTGYTLKGQFLRLESVFDGELKDFADDVKSGRLLLADPDNKAFTTFHAELVAKYKVEQAAREAEEKKLADATKPKELSAEEIKKAADDEAAVLKKAEDDRRSEVAKILGTDAPQQKQNPVPPPNTKQPPPPPSQPEAQGGPK